jgi:hypothetical protein
LGEPGARVGFEDRGVEAVTFLRVARTV